MPTKLTMQEFAARAHEVHNDKYSYPEEYKSANTKLKISCPIHGIFEQTPHNHVDGKNGCPTCGYEKSHVSRRLLISEFIDRANQIHNSIYRYSGEYENARTMIDIECSVHGIFRQTPDKHLQGQGCPKCGVGANVSKKETNWLNSLDVNTKYRQIIINMNGQKLKVDAYDPNTNTIYEFYGDYWHGNPLKFNRDDINLSVGKTFGELYDATMVRENLIKQAGYNLISLWENKNIK